VVEKGEFKGSLNDGKWQHRKMADEILSAPRLG
jgi:dihydropyrimidinase